MLRSMFVRTSIATATRLFLGSLMLFLGSCSSWLPDRSPLYVGTAPRLVERIADPSGGVVPAPVSAEFQTRLFGRVVSAKDGQPVPNCPIAAARTFPGAIYARSFGVVAQQTDSGGNFDFRDLSPGIWMLIVQDEEKGWVNAEPPEEWDVQFIPAKRAAVGPIQVNAGPGRSISFRVTDKQTGEPIEGARVAVGRLFNAFAFTDADGRASFRCMQPGSEFFRYWAEGYAKTSFVITAGQDGHEFDVALERGGVVTGRVTNEAGQPLSDLLVHGTSWSGRDDWHDRTNERGEYRLLGVPPAQPVYIRYGVPAGLLLRADYFPHSEITALGPGETQRTLDVTIPDRETGFDGVIEGRVLTPDRHPVPGAIVQYGFFDDPDLPETVTDPEGRYRLENLDEPLTMEARYLRVRTDGYPTRWVRAEPGRRSDPEEMDIILEAASHPLRGQIVDVEGNAPDFPVVVSALDLGIPVERTVANPGDGTFEFARVTDRTRVQLVHGYRAPVTRSVNRTGEVSELALGGEFREATIRVVDASTGAPIPQFQIRGDLWFEGLGLMVLDETGTYRIRSDREETEINVKILAKGYQPSADQTVILHPPGNGEFVEFRLTPSGETAAVAGRLLAADGSPYAHAEISLLTYTFMQPLGATWDWSNDPSGRENVQDLSRIWTDAEGRFSFANVPADGQAVDIVVSDWNLPRTRFPLAGFLRENWANLDLKVGRGARIRGRWNLGLKQRPPRIIVLYGQGDENDGFWMATYPDHLTGAFEFPGVQPGRYSVSLDPEIFPDEEFEVSEGGEHVVAFGFGPLGRVFSQVMEGDDPVANRLIVLHDSETYEYEIDPRGVSTDADGRFEFTEVPPGEYSLAVAGDNPENDFDIAGRGLYWMEQSWLRTTFENADWRARVALIGEGVKAEFLFAPKGTIRGRFASGEASPSEVRLLPHEQGQTERQTSPNGSGEFVFDKLSPGRYTLIWNSPSDRHGRGQILVALEADAGGVNLGPLPSLKGRSVVGRIRGAGIDPQSGIQIRISRNAYGFGQLGFQSELNLEEAGEFHFDEVPEGSYALLISSGQKARKQARFDVEAGDTPVELGEFYLGTLADIE